MNSYLWPCLLIDSALSMKLSSPITTSSTTKWWTDNSDVTLSYDYYNHISDRRSLKVVHDTSSSYITKGKTTEDMDDMFWENAYKDTISDIRGFTNYMLWAHSSSTTPEIGMKTSEYSTIAQKVFNNTYYTANKWCLLDGYIDLSSMDAVRAASISIESNSVPGTIYINSPMIVKKTASNISSPYEIGSSTMNEATGQYTWDNGLGFVMTSLTVNDYSYDITGVYEGNDYREVLRQIQAMRTLGVTVHDMLHRPLPKLSCVLDFAYLKTFMLYHETSKYSDTGHQLSLIGEPVVITNVNIPRRKQQPGIVEFQATLVKYTG